MQAFFDKDGNQWMVSIAADVVEDRLPPHSENMLRRFTSSPGAQDKLIAREPRPGRDNLGTFGV